MGKCVPSLRDEDHVEITIDHVSLKDCLDAGYTVLRVHCFLEFNYTESLWRDATLQGVVEKTINSGPAPVDRQTFTDTWEEMFPGIGQMFNDRWERWGKNPALKFAAKIKLNSMWGKHAERVNLPSTQIFDLSKDRDQIDLMWTNILQGSVKMKQATTLGNGALFYKTELARAKKDLHKGYIPAALMIPAYGRSQLWNQMHKLGTRVLMCDTDSIVYVYDPLLYNVPTGGMLGQWEEEDCSKTGILEFVGWGPKTYALRLADGSEVVKAKGISLNYATQNLFNFEIMKREVLRFINTGKMESQFIPQFTFEWSVVKEMQTVRSLKAAKICKDELKGKLVGSYLYPFGYEGDYE